MAHPVSNEMLSAADAWLDSLSPELREQAILPFDDEARTNWSYLPGKRPGVALEEMDAAQREKAHALLKSALSESGHLTAKEVIALEQVLRDMGGGAHRNPDLYYFTLFGKPEDGKPWAWRIEGHHLSINIAVVPGQLPSVTPSFFGANPAEVPIGERKGFRALPKVEDLARQIVTSLPEKLRQEAIIAETAPRDIETRGKDEIDPLEPKGVAFSEMDKKQQELLVELIGVYIDRYRSEIADEERAAIAKAGYAQIHFAWAGPLVEEARHYYRIQGPEFLIEYDNTNREGNHIHTVWREFDGDFGRDLLREHYESADHEHVD